MKVKCHYCNKTFDFYGNYSKFVWCSDKCKDLDYKQYKKKKENTQG